MEGADIEEELTADLVGDYLFTDADFVNRLSTENRNVFQQIYDEIKYLCKVVTAGSKEARQLEKAKKIFEDAFRAEAKNTVTEDGVLKYSLSDGTTKDASELSRYDLQYLLESAQNGGLSDGSYIPLRRNTPEFFIGVVEEHSNGAVVIEDHPMAATVEHLRQNMDEEDGQSYGHARPHGFSVGDIITISEKMGDPSYIVLQKNGRYAEVVSFYNERNKQVVVAIDLADSTASKPKNYKYTQYMNGYGEGYYNIIVTQFEPDSLAKYLRGNEVVYSKKEMNGRYQVGSGRIVTVTHDTPFIEDIVTEKQPGVNSEIGTNEDGHQSGDDSAKLSLSNDGEQIAPYGNWYVSGKDVALDIAPVGENVAVQEKTQLTEDNSTGMFPDDFPIRSDMFPDDFPIREELDELYQQKKALENRMQEARNAGDEDALTDASNAYGAVTAGSKEARQLEKAKKLFEDAFRAETKNTVVEDGVKYSLANIDDVTPNEEQKAKNIQEVAEMNSVYTVDASKLVPGEKSIKETYREFFTEWGENIHSDVFGDIAAKNSSIRSEMRHGSTPVKVASIEAIPSVIQNGKIVEWIQKDTGLFRIVVAAPIEIGESPYFMGVMLQRDSQNQRLYLHDVVIEKEASDLSQEHLDSTGPYEESENLYISSILDKIVEVKHKAQPRKNSLSEESTTNTLSKYAYMKPFADQLADFQKGNINVDDALVVGATPDVLKEIGLAGLPMTINQKHVGDALNGTYKGTQQEKLDHTFTAQELATLPEKLADPVAIIYDKRTGKTSASESNIDILVEMTVASGKQVLAAVQINGNGRINGIRIDTNKVATVHGNTDSVARLVDAIKENQNGNVAVFYLNNKKPPKCSRGLGIQYPAV